MARELFFSRTASSGIAVAGGLAIATGMVDSAELRMMYGASCRFQRKSFDLSLITNRNALSLRPTMKRSANDILLQRRRGQHRRSNAYVPYIVGTAVTIFVCTNLFFCLHLLRESSVIEIPPSSPSPKTPTEKGNICVFRQYPDHRYYNLQDQTPHFLQGDYIYGEWPQLLPTISSQKLCVDQSNWIKKSTSELPFADGTNPSIISVQRWKDHLGKHSHSSLPEKLPTNAHYLATACMTDSQCQWRDSPEQIKKLSLSTKTKADTIRTILFVLDKSFRVISETTLFLEHDANWGRRVKKQIKQGKPTQGIYAFDDARLFVHDGDLWVSYREGRGFGYESQVLNKLHINFVNGSMMRATLKASETTTFCCGRNMALMESRKDPHLLQSLTWVDPVTVIDVDITPLSQRTNKRRLMEITSPFNETDAGLKQEVNMTTVHRRLSPKKSHVHGTNAFMVYWPEHNVFLGIAHFHRPHDRSKNQYARFGHHYTHAFYTISAEAPFQLKSLSPEWVLPGTTKPTDAEIIQFASGLEIDGDEMIIAYGINDCESGLVRIHSNTIQDILRPVSGEEQVKDLMQSLKK